MTHFERTLDIDAAPDAVWAVLGRFMHVDEYSPLITSVDALTTGEDGVGSKRRCNFDNGTSVIEEVTVWEPNSKYRVQLLENSTLPMHEMHAELAVQPLASGRTKVIWSLDYRMKYGPFGWLLGQTMLKIFMGKIIKANLKALNDCVKA
jgi:carbon monoxide dehydrogenase subunit G